MTQDIDDEAIYVYMYILSYYIYEPHVETKATGHLMFAHPRVEHPRVSPCTIPVTACSGRPN